MTMYKSLVEQSGCRALDRLTTASAIAPRTVTENIKTKQQTVGVAYREKHQPHD